MAKGLPIFGVLIPYAGWVYPIRRQECARNQVSCGRAHPVCDATLDRDGELCSRNCSWMSGVVGHHHYLLLQVAVEYVVWLRDDVGGDVLKYPPGNVDKVKFSFHTGRHASGKARKLFSDIFFKCGTLPPP